MPDESIVFELLAHQDLKKFQEFIRNHYIEKKDHIFGKESSVFDWQHKGPHAYNCMVAKQEGALVGVMGFIPLSHFDNQLPKNQIFLGSIWKALEDRGVGIGLQLYTNIVKEYMPEFIAGNTIIPSAVQFYKWQGFKVGVMEHHVALSPYLDEFKIAKVPQNLKPKLQNLLKATKKKSLLSFKKVTKKDLPDLDTKGLYLHQLPLKSDAYIQNRYMHHPVYKYEVYAVLQGNKVLALCVIRPIFKEGSVVLRFIDFIGPNEAFACLGNFILTLLKTYNAEYIDLYSYGIPSALIQKAGFIDREKTDDLIIPDYFEPFVRKNVNSVFAYKSSQTYPPVRLFKGDGDHDRPSQIQGENRCRKK